MMKALLLKLCCTLLLLSPVAFAVDISTTFPDDQLSGQFTLSNGEHSVTFTGGEVRIAGITSLYRSGSRAFMVSDETADITFSSAAQTLRFFIRSQSTGNAFVRLLDAQGTELLRVDATSGEWREVTLTDSAGIDKVEFTNLATDLAAMEDFEYTALESSPSPTPIDDPIPAIIEEGAVKVRLLTVMDNLVSPVYGTAHPAASDFVFIVDQVGVLYALNVTTNVTSAILDVTDLLVDINPNFDERGLLGVTIHPDFNNQPYIFTYTSEPSMGTADFTLSVAPNHDSVIRKWQATLSAETGFAITPAPSVEMLRIEQPQFNHNGGTIIFDDSNMMLIALGDGGNRDDQGDGHSPGGNGQDFSNVLGNVLRIDPLGQNSANGKYGIPADNPFLADAGVLDEIWLTGVRNPYRISKGENTVYICDVGQNQVEEITRVTGGENLGWPLKEGSFAFNQNGDANGFVFDPDAAMLPPGLTDPDWEYDHDEGIAIICGFEYGGAIQALQGKFIFGDYLLPTLDQGRLFYTAANSLIAEIAVEAGMEQQRVLGFARANDGEVYILTNTTGVPQGNSGRVSVMELIENSAPIAVATASATTVNEGVSVTLTAENSSDAEGDPLMFLWSQTAGTDVTLSASNEESVTFTAPQVTQDITLSFMVEVSDGHLTSTDELTITVLNVAPPPMPSPPASSGSSGTMSVTVIFLMLMLGYRLLASSPVKSVSEAD